MPRNEAEAVDAGGHQHLEVNPRAPGEEEGAGDQRGDGQGLSKGDHVDQYRSGFDPQGESKDPGLKNEKGREAKASRPGGIYQSDLLLHHDVIKVEEIGIVSEPEGEIRHVR